ncbi:hypothetical protein FB45DRAFT_456659 [Roridomyces roridus]|uniref:Uncharacterized protein n=1 Tax=Roridomyces roridus TaxID=1738132 RepID=A0AAD7FQA5_9AGAR|nr:hypothetical protein FB45DRAFT_456659 [Roridomyces roridus]
MGYAAEIFLVLVLYCILHKFKASVKSIPCDPPPPRSDPVAKSASTHRRPWTTVLGLTFFFSAGLALLSNSPVSIQIDFLSFVDSVMAIERFLLDRWPLYYSLESHISAHALKYLQVFIVGIVSHCVSICAVSRLRRALFWTFSFLLVQLLVCVELVTLAVIASSSWLTLLFWHGYHLSGIEARDLVLPALRFFMARWSESYLAEVSTAMSIGTLHFSVGGAVPILYALIKWPRHATLLNWNMVYSFCVDLCLSNVCIHLVLAVLICDIFTKTTTPSPVHFDHWKVAQFQDLYVASNALRVGLRFSLHVWNTMPMAQKSLIVLPAILYYGHVSMIPAMRKVYLRVRHSLRR